jgi:hypothetical protein
MLSGLLLLVLTAGVEFEAVGSDGSTVRGELRAFTADRVTLETPSGPQNIPTSQLVRIAQPGVLPVSSEPLGAWLQLVDGSRLLGRSYSTAGGKAMVVVTDGVTVELPTAAVQAVRLKPMSPEVTAQWDGLAASPVKADCVVIREGGSLDFLEGVLGDVGPETFAFKLNDEDLNVKRAKAEGLIYFHAQRPTQTALVCTLADASGSHLNVAELSFADGAARLVTTGGVTATFPVARIALLEFPVRYLSGMKPESFAFTPRIPSPSAVAATVAQFYRPRFDVAPGRGPLRVGGREFAKGIVFRSRTEMTFLLPEPYSKFTAVAGIDDRRRPGGNVRLVIHGDDKLLFEQVLDGDDEPLPISLNLAGVARLKFLVDYGDDKAETGDQLDLCDPRLFP